MKSLSLLIFSAILWSSAYANSGNSDDYSLKSDWSWTAGSYCILKSSKVDSRIPKNKCSFEFEFKFPANENTNYSLKYSIDGKSMQKTMNTGEILKFITTPGIHAFQFYVEGYQEAFADSLLIKTSYCDVYEVNMAIQTESNNSIYKPVIYLYPEKETEVKVTIDINGNEQFLYPPSDGIWEFIAQPNGDLIFGDNTYNYLFWEANSTNSFPIDKAQAGFYVSKNEVVSFLDEKLTEANFTSKEKADFITFWGPKLMQNELNFVHFLFNEDCDRYADLAIDPAPENSYRIYMLFAPVSERSDLPEQELKAINREGFHVLEWGGQQQLMPSNLAQLKSK
ncbi:MAG: hypothetical protein ACI837_001093 [Crocinitomicaceae bacterium]|jgi:hypothetical protein